MSVTIKKEPHHQSLSDITTDTLVQVKEEDTKDVKIVIHQLQDVADELAERPDIEIKREAVTKAEDGLQNARLNQDVYYYCCNFCGDKMMDLRSTLLHKQEVHNIHQRSRYKHMNLEPDVDDPNNYCATCEKTFSTKDSFEYHLKALHLIVRVRATLEPEIDDPNFYCRQCDFTYMNQKFYFKHLKSYHGLKTNTVSKAIANTPRVIKKQQKKSKICCRACGEHFSSKKNYAYHTAYVHGISRKAKVDANMVVINSYEEQYQCRSCSSNFNSKRMYLEHLHSIHALNIDEDHKTPDVNDPNFFCRVCDSTSTSSDNFKTHLLAVHQIGASSTFIKVENDPSLPDPDDPNFYCRSCQHNFFFKDNYKKHLLLVHHYDLVADSSASSAFSSSLPDLHDPNFFCRVCQRGWKTYPPYRQHCKITHKMEVSPQRRSFYNAIIDPNDPKSYCAQCNRTYTNYRQHLKSAHNISTPAPSSSQ